MGSSLEWVKQIARAQAGKCGLTGLGRLLMKKIGKIVFVTDEQGHVLSWHVPEEQALSPQERVSLPKSVAGSNIMTQGISTFGGFKYSFYCWPIANPQKEGYLWVLTENEKLSAEEIESVEYLCSAMLVEIAKRQEHLELNQYLRDESILNMLNNNANNIETIGQVWGWNLSIAHIVVIIEGQTKAPGHGLLQARAKAEDFLAEKYPGMATAMIGNRLLALFPFDRKTREKDNQIGNNYKNIVKRAYAELQELLAELTLWAGVGNVYADAPLLYRSYQEAKVALEMGKALDRGKNLTFFNELGAIRLFYNQREQDLRDFFDETLGPVLKHDQKNDGNLLLTLWHYCNTGGDITAATKQMYIHANTLRYRLRKAEELLACSLDDQSVRFNIYASLKVGIMLGIFNANS